MLRLGEIGIPTHFIKRLNMREQLIKKVEIIPLEVICRNIAAGTMSKRLGIEEGEKLPRSIVELADEISPDSCRLWDRETNKKLDKDRFRRDLGNVTEAYTEVATRLGILKESQNKPAPNLSVVSNDE